MSEIESIARTLEVTSDPVARKVLKVKLDRLSGIQRQQDLNALARALSNL